MDTERKLQLLEQYVGRPLNRYEQLIARLGEISCTVLGAIRGNKIEFVLVSLEESLSEGDLYRLRLGSYGIAGLFSYRDGVADAYCEPDPNSWRVMVAATPTFLTYLAAKLGPKGDGTNWMEKLYQLPDTREN